MWLFLATEVMFFTGLIGTYIVERAGSPHDAFSNIYSPATRLQGLENTHGILLKSAGSDHHHVEHVLHSVAGLTEEKAAELVEEAPHALISGLAKLREKRQHGSAPQRVEEPRELKLYGSCRSKENDKWPVPYDEMTNPLAINLTAGNTFILICSSVTMVLALAAIQDGKKGKGSFFLGATVVIGSIFVGVQVYEYYQLMIGHHYPLKHQLLQPGTFAHPSAYLLLASSRGPGFTGRT